MSIVRMRKKFRSRMKVKAGKKMLSLPSPAEAIFYLIIIIFVAGAYYTFGGPGKGGGGTSTGTVHSGPSVIARVNGEKISRQLYQANVDQRAHSMSDQMDLTQERYLRSGVLSSLIDAVLMRQAAKKEGIKVSSADLKKETDKQVQQVISQRFPEDKDWVRYVRKQNKSPEQVKAELAKEISSDPEALREQVSRTKLQEAVEAKVTISDAELTDSYTEVKASHILIDPKKEAQKAEAQQAGAAKGQAAATTPVDGDALAKKKAEDLLARVKKGEDFAKLAKEFSDDPGSGARGGDLSWFKRGMMVKEFDEAAFKLQPNQVSELVKSDFGYHIIKATGRRSQLPKDFAKNKETYRQQVLGERKSRAWSEFQRNLTKEAQIEVDDPELAAYRLLDDNKQAEGTQKLEEAVKQNPQNVVALWELASLCEQKKDLARAISLLEQVTLNEEGATSPAVHLKLADLYLQQDPKDTARKALNEYTAAFDRAAAFSMQNFSVNMQVEQKLKQLGDTTKLAEVTKWLADYRKEQASNPMGGFGGPMGNFQVP